MIQTLSNLTIIIYAIAVMTMLLDTTPARLSRNKLSLLWAGAGIIALLQFFAGCVLGIKNLSSLLFFLCPASGISAFLAAFRQRTGENFFRHPQRYFYVRSCHVCFPDLPGISACIKNSRLPFSAFDQSYHALAHSPFYAAGLWAAARYFFVPGHFKIQRYSISL